MYIYISIWTGTVTGTATGTATGTENQQTELSGADRNWQWMIAFCRWAKRWTHQFLGKPIVFQELKRAASTKTITNYNGYNRF